MVQESGQVTLKVMSRPGRITMAGHIMTIVRNILGEEVAGGVGKIRMLEEKGEQVCMLQAFTAACCNVACACVAFIFFGSVRLQVC